MPYLLLPAAGQGESIGTKLLPCVVGGVAVLVVVRPWLYIHLFFDMNCFPPTVCFW